MNEHNKFAPEDMTTQKVDPATKPLRWGPGKLNMAVPDLGHLPNCALLEFDYPEGVVKWTEENPNALIYKFGTRGERFYIIYGELEDPLTREEKAVVSHVVDTELAKFRAERQKQEDELKAHEEDAKKEAEACRVIGRLCIEKHGAFVADLPKLSKLKNVRKSIADDILKVFEDGLTAMVVVTADTMNSDVINETKTMLTKKLGDLLKRYVKEGA